MRAVRSYAGDCLFITMLILALTMSLSTQAMATGKVVNVFFAGGQSNAVAGQFDAGIATSLAASGKFGDFVMVSPSSPGAPMYTWINGGQSSPARHIGEWGSYDDHFFNDQGTGALQQAVNAVRANGDIPKVGLFWFQGEGDTSSNNPPENWNWRFLAMMDFIRQDLGQDDPVPLGLSVIWGTDPSRTQAIATVRTAQFAIGDNFDYAVALDSKSYGRHDIWHLDVDERIRFGEDLGALYAANAPIPEPATLMVLGLGGLALFRRTR